MAKNIVQPKVLPEVDKAVELFVEWRDSPCELLAGLAPRELFSVTDDIDRIWFVGSQVWYPAVMGKSSPNDTDIDIVFLSQEASENYINKAKDTLASRDAKSAYALSTNVHSGAKLLKQGKGIIDVWWLPKGVSIAEHVFGYKHDHEHVAILAGASKGDFGALTRIVRPEKWTDKAEEELKAKAQEEERRRIERTRRETESWSDYSS